MKKLIGTLFLIGAAFLSGRADAAPVCVSTTNCTFTINSASSGTGLAASGNYGTVNLSLISGVIQITVDLNNAGNDPGLTLIDTGGHASFGFNYNGITGPLTIDTFKTTNSTGPASGWTLINTTFYQDGNASGGIAPYGTFNELVIATDCNGACAGARNVLRFDVHQTSGAFTDVHQLFGLSTLPPGDTRSYFAMDVATASGATGAIAVTGDSTVIINSVPEPQSAALLGTGLIGLAFAAKRMRRK